MGSKHRPAPLRARASTDVGSARLWAQMAFAETDETASLDGAPDVCRPYHFEGCPLSTAAIPDPWYDEVGEADLIGLLKDALRREDFETAAAMTVELLDFPTSWDDLLHKTQTMYLDSGPAAIHDPELVSLTRAISGGNGAGETSADGPLSAWHCYASLLPGLLAKCAYPGSASPGRVSSPS